MPFYTPPDAHPDDVDAQIEPGGSWVAVKFKDGVTLHAPPALDDAGKSLNAIECLTGRRAWHDHRQIVHDSWALLTHRAAHLRDLCNRLEHSAAGVTCSVGGLRLDGGEALMALRAEAYETAADIIQTFATTYDLTDVLRKDRRAAAISSDPIAELWAVAHVDAVALLARAASLLGDDFAQVTSDPTWPGTIDAMRKAVGAGDLEEAKRLWDAAKKPSLHVGISDVEMRSQASRAKWAWSRAASGMSLGPQGHPLYEATVRR